MDAFNSTGVLSRHWAPSDSRLLSNLIKAERTYINHLRSSVTAAQTASAALSAWGTSEAPDIADASARLGNLLAASADVQSTHVAAIEGYRAALKDVADREASIRTIVRDRDILVGRLIKASQKSASSSSKKSPEERAEKVAKAQRELSSCEQVLLGEEAALVGVKRRTFKEALTMRMKTMGDAGAAMVDAAKEAILLLDEFDSNAHQYPYGASYDELHAIDAGGGLPNDDSYAHPYAQQQTYDYGAPPNDEHLTVNNPNFENSSVTPSQSASQIYQPHNHHGYNAPFGGIAESGLSEQVPDHVQAGEPDSDDEDWQRAFGGGQHHIVQHNGGGGGEVVAVPAPHQLDHRAGAESDFVPQATQNFGAQQQFTESAPALPAKDVEDKRLSRSFSVKRPQASKPAEEPPKQLNYVPMPPVPTAPRMDANGITMSSVPTAPKLYMPGASGAQDDSSSEEDDRRATAHRGGASSWGTSAARGPTRENDDASSDEGSGRRDNHAGGAARKGGFFRRLFKSDEKSLVHSDFTPEKRLSRSNSQWNTRTDSNLRHSKSINDTSSANRRSRILSGPLVPQENDSSDEESANDRNLVRHVNKGPPLWQSSSDVGASAPLVARPGSIKRTPSASVTVGPLSWKAQQEASVPADQTSTKKKKKKGGSVVKSNESVDGGSEIGTQATRRKPSMTAHTPQQRHSVIVHGDASAGVRRSDSLNYGSVRKSHDSLAKRSSKRLSSMSTQQVHGYGTKAGVMSPGDPSGKFATTNWVAKSNLADEQPSRAGTSTPPIMSKPIASSAIKASAAPPKASKPPTQKAEEPPKHVPHPSRTLSPPLKPALKSTSNDLSRSGSLSGIAKLPILPDPVSAPPPASSTLEKDGAFDGTGSLNLSAYGQENVKRPTAVARTALPRIDMPASEPFKVDLEASKKKPTTPQNELGAHAHDSSPLLTPNERQAYNTFLSTHQPNVEEKKPKESGVTRTTVARASVGSGVLGPKNVPPPLAVTTPSAPSATAEGVTEPISADTPVLDSHPMRPGALSRSYSGEGLLSSDSSEDEDEQPMQAVSSAKPAPAPPIHLPATAAAVKKPASILSNSHLHVGTVDGSERSPEGSTVSRRKSVRMAPDVKLPPETPPGDGTMGSVKSPFGTSSSGGQHTSQLSSRIAPPPPAPARITTTNADRPIDLDNMRERTAWSTRIGMSRTDDSSDEEDAGLGADEYASARRNFGSISRSWGKATGQQTKTSTRGEGEESGKKKKKKPTNSNSGYNPAIPLPARMEVVGRSASKRGK